MYYMYLNRKRVRKNKSQGYFRDYRVNTDREILVEFLQSTHKMHIVIQKKSMYVKM